MKIGKTLVELATELQRQSEVKRDYLVVTEAIEARTVEVPGSPVGVELALAGGDKQVVVGINDLAHEQLGGWSGIPRQYYEKMLHEEPALLAVNLNTWFKRTRATRLVRTLDGRTRAFLSNSYRPMDSFDLAEAVLPVLGAMDLEIISCEVTERRIYLKAADKSITRSIPTGKRMGEGHNFFDTVSPGIVISNSEVGCGSLSVETGIWTKMCTNMLIASQRSMRKYHLGGRADLGEEVMAMLSDDTRRKTDAALWGQVRDVVKGAFDLTRFNEVANQMEGTVENKITGDPVKVIEVTAKKFGMGEGERSSVLRHLIEGGDLSQYGLINAVTRTAEDLDSYDRATEFERLGGKLIELPRTEWREISTAGEKKAA